MEYTDHTIRKNIRPGLRVAIVQKEDQNPSDLDISLPVFAYDLLTGPVKTPEDIPSPIRRGNCRLAVQLYFYCVRGLWLEVDQVLCPNLFRSTGTPVQDGLIDVLRLEEGDVILAERIRGKDGKTVDKSRAAYSTEDDWIIYLHSAVVKSARQNETDARIWHATSVAGGTCEWDWNEFEYYYRPVLVKRISDEDIHSNVNP